MASLSWPELFHTISGLSRGGRLPTPVEVIRAGRTRVTVRLESNSDAIAWLHHVGLRTRPQADRLGCLHGSGDWLGWRVNVVGAPQLPPYRSQPVVSIVRSAGRPRAEAA